MNRIKAFFRYSRTILVARLYTILGVLVAIQGVVLPWLMGQDWTPVFSYLLSEVPDEFRPILVGVAISATGELFVYLRKITRNSLEGEEAHPDEWRGKRSMDAVVVDDDRLSEIRSAINSGLLDDTIRARFGLIVGPERR